MFAEPILTHLCWSRKGRAVATLAILLIPRLAAGAPCSDAARAAATHRLLSLQNVDVEYSKEVDYTPSDAAVASFKARRPQSTPYVGKFTSEGRFSFLEGCCRYEEQRSPEALDQEKGVMGSEEAATNTLIISRERFEIFTLVRSIGPTGLIGNPSDHKLPSESVIDAALGLRGNSPNAPWIDAAALGKANFEADPATPDGVTVTVPVGGDSKLVNKWWLLLKSSDAEVTRYAYATPDGTTYAQTDCSDFRENAAGLSVPFMVVCKRYYHGKLEPAYCSQTIVITVKKYNDEKENTMERYLMIWPVGTRVYDQRTRNTLLIRSAPRTLDDDYIAAASEAKLREAQERLSQIATQPVPATTQP